MTKRCQQGDRNRRGAKRDFRSSFESRVQSQLGNKDERKVSESLSIWSEARSTFSFFTLSTGTIVPIIIRLRLINGFFY
jgi:hypothetical protein